MENTREREAQLGESTGSTDRLKFGRLHRGALALDGVGGLSNGGSTCAAKGDCSSTFGNSIAHVEQAVQVGKDVVELAGKEEPHVSPAVELGDKRYPGRRQLNFTGVNVLRVAVLRAPGKQLLQIARSTAAIRGVEYVGGSSESDIRDGGTGEDTDGAG